MSFDLFEACLKNIPKEECIVFSGMSEPWLNRECTKMVAHASREGYKVEVFTTLVGMDPEDVGLLEQAGISRFIVHLPSEEYREIKDISKQYRDTLNRVCHSTLRAEFRFHGLRIDQRIKPLLGEGRFCMNIGLHDRAGCINFPGIKHTKRKRGILVCTKGLHHNILMPNGDVLLCCMDFSMEHILGNLLNSGWKDIFEGEEFLKIKRGLRNPSSGIVCRFCIRACPSWMVKLYGSIKELLKPVKESEKQILR